MLRVFRTPPKKTFIVHGEPEAQEILAARIRDEFGWAVEIPEFGYTAKLGNKPGSSAVTS